MSNDGATDRSCNPPTDFTFTVVSGLPMFTFDSDGNLLDGNGDRVPPSELDGQNIDQRTGQPFYWPEQNV